MLEDVLNNNKTGEENETTLMEYYFPGNQFTFQDNGFAVKLSQSQKPGGFELVQNYMVVSGVTVSEVTEPSQEMISTLGLTVTDNIYEAEFPQSVWDNGRTISIMAKGNDKLEAEPSDYIKFWKYDGTSYTPVSSAYGDEDGYMIWFESCTPATYDSSFKPCLGIQLVGRKPFSNLPSGTQLIVVFYGAPESEGQFGPEIGTFIIKY